jgi:hypothetical protein
MVTSRSGTCAVSSFSLESKRAFAVGAERATPKFDAGDETQPCTKAVTSMVTY